MNSCKIKQVLTAKKRTGPNFYAWQSSLGWLTVKEKTPIHILYTIHTGTVNVSDLFHYADRTFCKMRIYFCSSRSLDRDCRSLDRDFAERNGGFWSESLHASAMNPNPPCCMHLHNKYNTQLHYALHRVVDLRETCSALRHFKNWHDIPNETIAQLQEVQIVRTKIYRF
jgi:hypothetical protein